MKSFPIFWAFALALSFSHFAVEGKNWAVIVDGVVGWWNNYPSSADLCRFYQVAKASGIPEENIIVFMEDDIANNSMNPRKGKIYNSPVGNDVYKGVKIDYTGKEVTKKNLEAVLTGDKDAVLREIGRNGKVLASGPEDNVLFIYGGYGGYGYIALPMQEEMFARELNETFTKMYENKRYKKLVVYMSASYSGTMFDEVLSPNINIYALASSSSSQGEYLMYCDAKFELMACFATEFGCNVLGDTEASDLKTRTFDAQVKAVNKSMLSSTPTQFGDLSIAKDTLATFFGNGTTNTFYKRDFVADPNAGMVSIEHCNYPARAVVNGELGSPAIPTSNAYLYYIKSRLAQVPAQSKLHSRLQQELAALEKLTSETESLFLDIARPFFYSNTDEEISSVVFNPEYEKVKNWDCYEDAVRALFRMCPAVRENKNPATTQKIVSLLHLCNREQRALVFKSLTMAASRSPACL